MLGKEDGWDNRPDASASKSILAFTVDHFAKTGFKVNYYRNKSVHPNHNFDVGLSNVLYCGIALALYATKGRWENIKTEEIAIAAKTLTGKGNKDLIELLNSRH